MDGFLSKEIIMSKNVGKKFEKDFMDSAPKDIFTHRLRDSVQAFSKSSRTQFSNKNPYDFFMWNPHSLTPYALELKTVAGKSISFERSKEEKADIHYHQICGLKKVKDFGEFVAGFVIEFRELAKTIFLDIDDFLKLSNTISKKSFTITDLDNNGIYYTVINQTLKRTRYSYDIDNFLKNTGLHYI